MLYKSGATFDFSIGPRSHTSHLRHGSSRFGSSRRISRGNAQETKSSMGAGGGFLEGGGPYFKSYIFDEIHNNFSKFTITPVTKTEQETERNCFGRYHHFTNELSFVPSKKEGRYS